jgi:hypothetical protein
MTDEDVVWLFCTLLWIDFWLFLIIMGIRYAFA